MKKVFKISIGAIALVVLYISSQKVFRNSNHVFSNLLMENVEALSSGEIASGSNFAKDYETGEGLYLVKINGVDVTAFNDFWLAFFYYGNFIHPDQNVLEFATCNEWKMTCQPNLGCYYSCKNEDWQRGTKTPGVDYGCSH